MDQLTFTAAMSPALFCRNAQELTQINKLQMMRMMVSLSSNVNKGVVFSMTGAIFEKRGSRVFDAVRLRSFRRVIALWEYARVRTRISR